MVSKIFYFTGSGNTLKLAKDLAQEVGGVELVKISYTMEFDQSDCNVAGIAYPVYCFGLPNIVVNFIEKVQFHKNAYTFGLASYGGLLTASGKLMKKTLAKRNLSLNAGFAVRMPGNATMVYDVPKAEKREGMYKVEQERIKQIAATVKNKSNHTVDTNLGILGSLASSTSGVMMKKINETDKAFFVDEKCNSCGICEKICPVQNITMIDGKPQWRHKCESCLACFHWCPQAAIQSGKKTASRSRYHHPDIELKDMM
ncbi:MAG: 4Fe-4S ferredoxin [Chitinivibrionales bacterium]|nr:4Fe-4S ferredoxin [Chitinivibrionales bacterium]